MKIFCTEYSAIHDIDYDILVDKFNDLLFKCDLPWSIECITDVCGNKILVSNSPNDPPLITFITKDELNDIAVEVLCMRPAAIKSA